MGERAEAELTGGPYPSECVLDECVADDIRRVMYPAPWRVYLNTGNNRARIVDASGGAVANGMNALKARIIAQAVNRDRAAPDMLAALHADVDELEYYIGNPSAWESYDEAMSERLRKVHGRARVAIAKAEGR